LRQAKKTLLHKTVVDSCGTTDGLVFVEYNLWDILSSIGFIFWSFCILESCCGEIRLLEELLDVA
jgi:hypothetical protein